MTQILVHDDLPPEYTQTVFESSLPAGECPEQFAIVTAYNPDGNSGARAENQRRDRALREILESRERSYSRVTGCSPDGSHREPGYAIQITLDAAIALGRELQQKAVFWISNDQLSVVSCATHNSIVLGSFGARLRDGSDIEPREA